ncbi:MAG: hypothetical protein MK005_13355 [Alcanivorax sp.]|nr:hypothetical protein [Alcanivorax sp.]
MTPERELIDRLSSFFPNGADLDCVCFYRFSIVFLIDVVKIKTYSSVLFKEGEVVRHLSANSKKLNSEIFPFLSKIGGRIKKFDLVDGQLGLTFDDGDKLYFLLKGAGAVEVWGEDFGLFIVGDD